LFPAAIFRIVSIGVVWPLWNNGVECAFVSWLSAGQERLTVSGKDPGKDARRELTLAGMEIESGDLVRAAVRVSNVLVQAPALPEAHEVLARLAAHPRGGRDLFPMTDPLALARVVARAHVVAAEGAFGEALRLLGKAQAYAPETGWADVPWVTGTVTASSVNPAVVTNLAVDLLELLRERGAEALSAAMYPYLHLIRNTIAAHPDDANLLGAAGYFVRRFDAAEAAGYARRADELAPCHASACALGLIHRDLGHTSEALQAFERALSYQPGDLEIYADICDLLLDADRLDEALACAQRALAIDPGHACSQIAARAVAFRQACKATDLDALMELCRTQPAGSHARRHGERVLQSAVMKTADRITTVQGTPRGVLAQTRRFLRGRPQ
jgi:tetratricopeptide (TPR) repeat protein